MCKKKHYKTKLFYAKMQQKDISENWKLPLVQKEYVLPFVGTLPPF
jgi:hypothetical protein